MTKILLLILLPSLAFGQELARVLSHQTIFTIRSKEDVKIEETYRIRINSEKGRMYGTYQDYTDQFRKITDVTVDIFDASGKKVKRLKRGDGLEIGFNPSYEINDGKILIIRPDYQNYPFEVEVNSTIVLNGYNHLDPWIPRPMFNMAVDQSKLVLIRPKELDPRLREVGVKGTTITEKGMLKTTYEVTALPAIERKLRYRDFYDEQPKVLMSPVTFKLDNSEGSTSTWAAFGDWFLSLNSAPYKLDPKTMELIQSMDKADKAMIIRRLYEYMQDKTRYVSIQLGIGGFQSLPTEDVEKYGYGDCKALTTYMKNMLDFAGIPSNYILVRAGNDAADVMADFPSNQFNHVYLGIPMPRDTMYLECTSQISPTNFTGTFTDDRNVLWIDKGKSDIMRSRVYNHRQNIKSTKSEIKLEPDGDANLSLDVTNEGTFFDEIMIYKSAPGDYVTEYNQRKFDYGNFTIKNFSYKQDDRNEATFKISYNLDATGLAKAAGTRLVLPGVPATPFKKFIDGDDLMRYASVRRGATVEDEIVVQMPQNYWIYSLPEKETIDSPFGTYSLSSEFDGDKLVIKRKLVLYKGDYTQKAFDDFKVFYQKLERIESRKLVLNAKT